MRTMKPILTTDEQIAHSGGVHRRSAKLLNELTRRMTENIKYYENNDLITSTFDFLIKIIDTCFPLA